MLIGSLLAVTSYARVDFSGGTPALTAKADEVWLSASTLFVTQDGFPWGRTIFDETVEVGGTGGDGEEPTQIPRFGDPGRYSGLATLYVELAKGDEVRRSFRAKAPPGVAYQPEVVKSSDGGSVLPMIYMKGFGPTAELAEAAANIAAQEFQRYLASEQVQARISEGPACLRRRHESGDPGRDRRAALDREAHLPLPARDDGGHRARLHAGEPASAPAAGARRSLGGALRGRYAAAATATSSKRTA